MTKASTIELTDGRLIGFEEAGEPDGVPVLFFHGTPGSRRYWTLMGPGNPARDHGVRLISLDRPGLGLSSPEPQRSVGSFAFDVARLAEELGIDRFALYGFSGGAPYALAVAALMPHSVTAVALVSPMGDLSVPGLMDSLDGRLRKAIAFATEAPTARASAVADLLGTHRVVSTIADHMWTQLPSTDRSLLSSPLARDKADDMLREAARQGIEGARLDIDLMTRKWDFPLEDVQAPVLMTAGDKDPWAPAAMTDWLGQQLVRASLRVLPGEGHFSVLVRHGGEVLELLVSAAEEAGQPVLGHSDHDAMTSSATAR